MRNVKQTIALFYIALILLFKVANLHALSHQTDDYDLLQCEVSDTTTAFSSIPLLQTTGPVLAKTEYFFVAQKTNANSFLVTFSNQYLSSYLYTRPPPPLS